MPLVKSQKNEQCRLVAKLDHYKWAAIPRRVAGTYSVSRFGWASQAQAAIPPLGLSRPTELGQNTTASTDTPPKEQDVKLPVLLRMHPDN